MFVAVLVRGTRNLRRPVKLTLSQLKLTRRYHAVLLPDTPTSRGMLKKANFALAWGEASDDVVKKLTVKGKNPFRLHPPRKRFGPLKKQYPHGLLGHWGKDVNQLVESML